MKISENLFIVLTIFAVVAGVIYFFYNSSTNRYESFAPNPTQTYSIQFSKEVQLRPQPQLLTQPQPLIQSPKKRVRFDDNIKCAFYKKYPNEVRKKKTEVEPDPVVDLILSEATSVSKSRPSPKPQPKPQPKPKPQTNELEPQLRLPSDSIIPSNLDLATMGDTWDASFGLPLMSQKEQGDYFARMMDNYKKYDKAVGEFYEYQTDQKAILKTDTTIDPFKPSTRSACLNGKAVADIYDEQVAGPQAIPKEIRKVTASETFYADESAMNGGRIRGSDLFGINGHGDNFESAAFGNGF